MICAGAVLGLCAGLLWTAQGSLMLSYATENQKGRMIAVFWSIFNAGGVIGAAVAAILNHGSREDQVSDATYVGFLVLTALGTFIPLFMTDPRKMIRTDGTRVGTPRHPSWRIEFYSLWIALKTDPMILLL